MRSPLVHRVAAPIALGMLLAACGADPGPHAALAAFARFQDALLHRDEAGCRAALTVESAAALTDMPWHEVERRQPLTVLGADASGAGYLVHVADPNAGGAAGEFVVVREYGKLVVDLVASAGLTERAVDASSAREQLEPRVLTPADHERIREFELAQPPR